MTVIKSENEWYNHSFFSQREGERSREKESEKRPECYLI